MRPQPCPHCGKNVPAQQLQVELKYFNISVIFPHYAQVVLSLLHVYMELA